jgi:hypothetical protein
VSYDFDSAITLFNMEYIMKIILKNEVRSAIFASFVVFGLNGILHAAELDDRSSMGQPSSKDSSMSGSSSSGQGSSSSEREDSRDPSDESSLGGDTGMAPSSTGSDNTPGLDERKDGKGSSATGRPSPQGSSTPGSSSSDRENKQHNY